VIVAVAFRAPDVRAGETRTVLLLCEGEVLDAGEGGCERLLGALEEEMAVFDVDVVAGPSGPCREVVEGEVAPESVQALTLEQGALFTAWVTRAGADLAVHVYDPESRQTFTRVLAQDGGQDLGDVAFHIRNLMSASLWADIEDVAGDETLFAIAVPEEKAEVVAEVVAPPVVMPPPVAGSPPAADAAAKPAPRRWVRADVGWMLEGHPTSGLWLNGFDASVALVPTPRLEILVGAGLAFAARSFAEPAPGVRFAFESRVFSAHLGVRGAAVVVGPLEILAGGGIDLIVPSTHVSGEGTYRDPAPALWAEIAIRVEVVDRLSVVLAVRPGYALRRQVFTWADEEMHGTAGFRMQIGAGLSVAI